jgi:hypothetical protein
MAMAKTKNVLTFPYATRKEKMTLEYLVYTRHSLIYTQKQNIKQNKTPDYNPPSPLTMKKLRFIN